MSSKPTDPKWQFLKNLFDENPLIYGGLFVYQDKRGRHEACAEYVQADHDDPMISIYRFDLTKCTYVSGILSDNKFHPGHPAWFAKPESERAKRPQDTTYLANVVADFGMTEMDLINAFCSVNPVHRASAWAAVGHHHGWENLDEYPLVISRKEAQLRYDEKNGIIYAIHH
jgi:hypothetical protein